MTEPQTPRSEKIQKCFCMLTRPGSNHLRYGDATKFGAQATRPLHLSLTISIVKIKYSGNTQLMRLTCTVSNVTNGRTRRIDVEFKQSQRSEVRGTCKDWVNIWRHGVGSLCHSRGRGDCPAVSITATWMWSLHFHGRWLLRHSVVFSKSHARISASSTGK